MEAGLKNVTFRPLKTTESLNDRVSTGPKMDGWMDGCMFLSSALSCMTVNNFPKTNHFLRGLPKPAALSDKPSSPGLCSASSGLSCLRLPGAPATSPPPHPLALRYLRAIGVSRQRQECRVWQRINVTEPNAREPSSLALAARIAHKGELAGAWGGVSGTS